MTLETGGALPGDDADEEFIPADEGVPSDADAGADPADVADDGPVRESIDSGPDATDTGEDVAGTQEDGNGS